MGINFCKGRKASLFWTSLFYLLQENLPFSLNGIKQSKFNNMKLDKIIEDIEFSFWCRGLSNDRLQEIGKELNVNKEDLFKVQDMLCCTVQTLEKLYEYWIDNKVNLIIL